MRNYGVISRYIYIKYDYINGNKIINRMLLFDSINSAYNICKNDTNRFYSYIITAVMTLDINTLLRAIDNENNEGVLQLTSTEIKRQKNDILQKLGVKGKTLADLHKKLKDYRYIEDLEQLNYGSFVRWINISDPTEVYITNGGHICDMVATDNSVKITCKNVYNSFFNFDFNSCLVFQKLSNQERVLLIAMDNLAN